jgi:anti-sigma factor RsiW
MTCQELVELVTDYLEGALSRADAARFESHVAACPGCEIYIEQMRSTIAVVRAVRRR